MRLKRPSLLLSAALLGVLVGAGLGELLSLLALSLIYAGLVLAAAIVFALRPAWLLMVFALGGLFFGYGRLQSELADLPSEAPGEVELQAEVIRVEEQPDRQRLTLGRLYFDGEAADGKLLAFAPRFPDALPGDQIALSCDVQLPEPFDGFDYDKFLAARDIHYTCFARSFQVTGARNSLRRIVHMPRAFLDRQIESRFGFAESSLLAGLLYGEKEFTDGMNIEFQRTGTTHIVAASGYNVTIVALVLFTILTHLYIPRRRAFALILAGIWLYVLLVGLEAPIVRAGIMGSVVLLSRQLGRAAKFHNALLLAGAVLAVASPFVVRYDVGFQLSLFSTFGLMYLSPKLTDAFKFVPGALGLRESITSTVAATLVTLPIVALQFSSFSLLSPIANLLVLPWLPYAMFSGFFAAILPVPAHLPFLAAADTLLSLPLLVIHQLSELSFAYIEFHSLTLKFAVALAAIIVTLWLLKRPSHKSA